MIAFKPLIRKKIKTTGTIYGIKLKKHTRRLKFFFKERYSKFFLKDDFIIHFLAENKKLVNEHYSRYLVYDQEENKVITEWEMEKKQISYKWNCAVCDKHILIRIDTAKSANPFNFLCKDCKTSKMPKKERRRLVIESSLKAIKHYKKYHENILKNILKD